MKQIKKLNQNNTNNNNRLMPLHPSEMYPLSMDSKKIFCAYHQTEFLTNFCQEKQCLMPLCPSCIAQHTQQHFMGGKKPTYTNINQALNRAKQSCYCTIITLEQYKKLNADIYSYISSLQENIHIQLTTQRNHLFSIITQLFSDYQTRLIKQITQNYQQKSVYLIEQTINASRFIDQEITNLYEKISLLKGEECLSSLITYYAVDEQNYKESLEEFDQYFEKNRKAGKIQVSIVEEALGKLTGNLCDSLLAVECVIQNFQTKPEEPEENPGLRSKRYGFNKYLTSSETLQASRQLSGNKENLESNPSNNPTTNFNNNTNNNFLKRDSLADSRRSRDRIGVISRNDKDMSFNPNPNPDRPLSQTNPSPKPPLPVTRTHNDSLSNESNMSRKKSVSSSHIVVMDDDSSSKRLIRGFKKLP